MKITAKEIVETMRRTEEFFRNLIEITGIYFLSDCVHETSDYVGGRVSKELCSERDELKRECSDLGLDIHQISQSIAEEFLTKSNDDGTSK